jgi:hypothetical protein
VFTAEADGPFMMIDMPNGDFKITASADGRTQTRQVRLLEQSHDHVIFVWRKEAEPAR